jgi:hypothetical protein
MSEKKEQPLFLYKTLPKKGTSRVKTDSLEIKVIANCSKANSHKLLKENRTL